MPRNKLFTRTAIIVLLLFYFSFSLHSSQAQENPFKGASGQNEQYIDLQNGFAFLYPKDMSISIWQGTTEIPASVSLQPLTSSASDEAPEVGVGLYQDRTQDVLAWLNSHRSAGFTDTRPVAFAEVEILATKIIAGKPTVFFTHNIFGRMSLSAARIIGKDQLVVVNCTDGCSDPALQSGFAMSIATLQTSTPRQPTTSELSQIQVIIGSYTSTRPSQPKPPMPQDATTLANSDYWLPFPTNTGWQVTQGWNGSTSHTGIAAYAYDFGMPEGNAVVASRDGTVASVTRGYTACGGSNLGNSANRVVLNHNDGSATLYLHLQSVPSSIIVGMSVSHGTLIGISGKTGWTGCGPHLHFQRQQQGIWWTQSREVYFNEYPNQQLLVGRTYVANHSAGAGCAIAVGDGTSRPQLFIDAYNRRGGRATLGCPINGVHWWGSGDRAITIQDFRGGSFGDVAIIHDEQRDNPANSVPAYVIQGGIWSYYTQNGGVDSWLGPLTSDEFGNETGQAQNNFRHGYINYRGGNPEAVAWPSATSGQWRAEYHNGTNTNGFPTWVRNETGINYDWGTGAPGGGRWGVWSDNFSVRWTGDFFFESGTYTFIASVDDGVRVWVDGALIIDHWIQPGTYHVPRTMTAGWHAIRVESFEAGGGARTAFSWTRDHSSNLASPTAAGATSGEGGLLLPTQIADLETVAIPAIPAATHALYIPHVSR